MQRMLSNNTTAAVTMPSLTLESSEKIKRNESSEFEDGIEETLSRKARRNSKEPKMKGSLDSSGRRSSKSNSPMIKSSSRKLSLQVDDESLKSTMRKSNSRKSLSPMRPPRSLDESDRSMPLVSPITTPKSKMRKSKSRKSLSLNFEDESDLSLKSSKSSKSKKKKKVAGINMNDKGWASLSAIPFGDDDKQAGTISSPKSKMKKAKSRKSLSPMRPPLNLDESDRSLKSMTSPRSKTRKSKSSKSKSPTRQSSGRLLSPMGLDEDDRSLSLSSITSSKSKKKSKKISLVSSDGSIKSITSAKSKKKKKVAGITMKDKGWASLPAIPFGDDDRESEELDLAISPRKMKKKGKKGTSSASVSEIDGTDKEWASISEIPFVNPDKKIASGKLKVKAKKQVGSRSLRGTRSVSASPISGTRSLRGTRSVSIASFADITDEMGSGVVDLNSVLPEKTKMGTLDSIIEKEKGKLKPRSRSLRGTRSVSMSEMGSGDLDLSTHAISPRKTKRRTLGSIQEKRQTSTSNIKEGKPKPRSRSLRGTRSVSMSEMGSEDLDLSTHAISPRKTKRRTLGSIQEKRQTSTSNIKEGKPKARSKSLRGTRSISVGPMYDPRSLRGTRSVSVAFMSDSNFESKSGKKKSDRRGRSASVGGTNRDYKRSSSMSEIRSSGPTNRRAYMNSLRYKEFGESWLQFLQDTGCVAPEDIHFRGF